MECNASVLRNGADSHFLTSVGSLLWSKWSMLFLCEKQPMVALSRIVLHRDLKTARRLAADAAEKQIKKQISVCVFDKH